MKTQTKEETLLNKLKYLSLLLEDGVQAPAFRIQNKVQVDSKMWHKLIYGEIIEMIGSSSKPIYKWIAKQPDLLMATELLKEYPELIKDAVKENPENNINPLNSKIMLTEKNQLFDWFIPKVGTQGRSISEDFRVNCKHYTLYIGCAFMDKNYPEIDRNNVHVAFVSLESTDKPFLVFNPNKGVPYTVFNAGKGNTRKISPSKNSKDLATAFKNKFNIKEDIMGFRLERFQNFNGMTFYEIIPLK